jgi:butyrate kinase
MRILVINPGSTSTKISIFEDEKEIFSKKIDHPVEELAVFKKISDQLDFRKEALFKTLEESGFKVSDFDVVGARGGNSHPLESGVYRVNEKLVDDLLSLRYGAHASNLGAPLAYEIVKITKVPAYIVDPVIVDEMEPIAKVTGLKGIEREARDHPLNQKAAAREAAKTLGKKYSECNFVVAHLGGGISVAAHRKGRMIDENNALNGDGPFSPERAGDLPNIALLNLCFSGKYTKEEIQKMLTGKGGLVSHLGTNSLIEVENRVSKGDECAKLIYGAMIYQISKEIGKQVVVLKGQVDGIVLTGGLAYSERLVNNIKEYISFMAPVFVFPGEHEMEAIAAGILRVYRGEEKKKEYS